MTDRPSGPDDLTRRTTYTFDRDGNLVSRVTTFDALGLVTAAHDEPGIVTWMVYDSDRRVIDRGTDPPEPNAPPDEPPDEPHVVG